jgi:outer membrane autotransporter protein
LFTTYDGTTQFDVAESTSGVSGSVSDIDVSDNSFLFNNALVLSGNKIVSAVSQDATNFSVSVLGADNFALINNALDNADLTAGIISLGSMQQLDQGLETLKPINNESIVNTSLLMNDNATNVIGLHLQQINADYAGFSADDAKYKNDGKIWGQVFGATSSQSKIKDDEGYKANSGGLMFGGDHIFGGETNVILGGALAYNKANISNNLSATSKNNDANISSYQIILYNNNAASNGLGFYNNNIINFASNQYKTNRNIVLGSIEKVAQASFDGSSYGAKTNVGYNFKLEDDLLFAPNVGLKYFSLSQDNYQETGAGDSGLKVSNEDFHSLISEVGFNFTSKFEDEYFNYIPKLNITWEHSLNNNAPKSTFEFIGGGTKMQTDSINIQKNKFNLGLAINISDESDSSLQLQYNLQLSERFISNSGSLQYRYVF